MREMKKARKVKNAVMRERRGLEVLIGGQLTGALLCSWIDDLFLPPSLRLWCLNQT
jgi:hypothetical protein